MSARSVILVVSAVAVSYVVIVGLTWAFQRSLIYFPSADRPPSASRVFERGEDVVFTTSDGIQLSGWFVPARQARATIVVFNGNAGHRAYRAGLGAGLSKRGFSVLLFDYRGYGGHAGSPTEEGLIADARAARTYLAGRADVDASRIVYFGESLGCAVALGLAVEYPPSAMVLRSPFWSLGEVGRHHYWYLPITPLLKDRFSSYERIARVSCPVLVIAGAKDQIVPADQSRRLYEEIRGPKKLVMLPGADHNDEALAAGPVVLDEVVRFLDEEMDRSLGLRDEDRSAPAASEPTRHSETSDRTIQ